MIPEAQLETWCNQGATTIAQAAHTSVRYALETSLNSPVRNKNLEIFLQGSYRNYTNIYADSDVDIVVQLNGTFTYDLSLLQPAEQAAVTQGWGTLTYPWHDFRTDVLETLRNYYGNASVRDGNKAINLVAAPGRLSADIIPAVQHRLYRPPARSILSSFVIPAPIGEPYFVEGISFWDKLNRQVINYPKRHIENGQNKNSDARTGGQYKPAVRMFKNARNKAMTDRLIADTAAASYFVECLLYNVPDNLFTPIRQQTMRGILDWLRDADKTLFWCQNNTVFLFGETQEQWNTASADALIDSYIKLWNRWT